MGFCLKLPSFTAWTIGEIKQIKINNNLSIIADCYRLEEKNDEEGDGSLPCLLRSFSAILIFELSSSLYAHTMP